MAQNHSATQELVVCLELVICVFVVVSVSQPSTTHTAKCDTTFCYNNGHCNMTADDHAKSVRVCACLPYFIGPNCEVLNMTLPKFKVDKLSITFTWPEAIQLHNYSCVYFETEQRERFSWQKSNDDDDEVDEDSLVTVRLPSEKTNTVKVDNLKGDATSYVMCFLHQSVFEGDNRVIEQMDPARPNCGWVVTSYGGGMYTYAAKFVAISMLLAVVIIIAIRALISCSDKDKRRHMTDDLKTGLENIRAFHKRLSQRESTCEDNPNNVSPNTDGQTGETDNPNNVSPNTDGQTGETDTQSIR